MYSPLSLFPSKLLDQNFGMCITPEDLIIPCNNNCSANYFRPWRLSMPRTTNENGSSIENTKDKLQIILDVQHFKPNEISVKVVEREIQIEGKHEEKIDEHGIVSRHFTRRYQLPKDCYPEDVSSTLSSDGVLTIIANRKQIKEIKDERPVPIKLCEAFTQKCEVEECKNYEEKERTTVTKTEEQKSEAKDATFDKSKSQIMLLEDSKSFMKPEAFSSSACAAGMSTTECSKSKLEMEESNIISSQNMQSSMLDSIMSLKETSSAISGKGEVSKMFSEAESSEESLKLIEKSSEESLKLAGQMGQSCMMMESSDMSRFTKVTTSETMSEESSYMSSSTSMSASVKATESIDMMSATLSAALKEAADF